MHTRAGIPRNPIVPPATAQKRVKCPIERAIPEYKAIAENPGIDPISPMYPLSYLGMARAYSLEGKGAESRAACERFFDLGKGADANLPVMQEVRREYTKLTN